MLVLLMLLGAELIELLDEDGEKNQARVKSKGGNPHKEIELEVRLEADIDACGEAEKFTLELGEPIELPA